MFGLFRRRNIKIPRREYDALIGASIHLAGHLEGVLEEARDGLMRKGQVGLAEFKGLMAKLEDISGKTAAHYRAVVEGSAAKDNIFFDTMGHARYVAPAADLLTVPGNTVKSMKGAIELGSTSPLRLYELAIAELDAALQRWRVAPSAVINMKNQA
jgi:hypothetical protein